MTLGAIFVWSFFGSFFAKKEHPGVSPPPG
mgnify:CR=1 FL=1